jgi:hypothetical protein
MCLSRWKEVCPQSCKNLVILGDSHAQTAFDSLSLPTYLNMAQSSEELVFTYYKLNHLIKSCCKIDTVIISLSFHTLLEYAFKPSDFANESMNRYALILDDFNTISEWNTHKAFWINLLYWRMGLPNKNTLNYSFQSINNELTFDRLPFRGGSVRHQNSNILKADIDKLISRHFFSKSGETIKISKMQLFYLLQLIQLCQTYNIQMIFVNTPVSESYLNHMPKKYERWLKHIQSYLQMQHRCMVLDLSRTQNKPDFFYDHDHLNLDGAREFTRLFHDLILSPNARDETKNHP